MVVTGILTLNPSVPLKMEKIEHEITKRTDGGSNLESYDGPELETSEAMRAQQFSLRPLRCPPGEGTRPASPTKPLLVGRVGLTRRSDLARNENS